MDDTCNTHGGNEKCVQNTDQGNIQAGRHRHSIKINLIEEIGCKYVGWIHMAHDNVH